MNNQKLYEVAGEAFDMIFEHVASQYPEAKSGDLSPEKNMKLNIALNEAIEEWVRFNACEF